MASTPPTPSLEVPLDSFPGALVPQDRVQKVPRIHGCLLSPGSAMPASRHTTHTRTNKTACSILTTLAAAVIDHAQMGTLPLRQLSDLPRIVQAEGKSTVPDLLEFSPRLFPLSSLAPLPIHPLGCRRRGPTLSALTSQVSTSVCLSRGSSEFFIP